MVTAPLRAEYDLGSTQPANPRLILKDYTQTVPKSPTRSRTRRNTRQRWEDQLFAVAIAAVLLFCLASVAISLYRTAASSYQSSAASAIVLPVRVHQGDSLWTYAKKYGAPDVYILDRVEAIARANHLPTDAPLVPGQRLFVPVTNPVVVAQLESAHRLAHR